MVLRTRVGTSVVSEVPIFLSKTFATYHISTIFAVRGACGSYAYIYNYDAKDCIAALDGSLTYSYSPEARQLQGPYGKR